MRTRQSFALLGILVATGFLFLGASCEEPRERVGTVREVRTRVQTIILQDRLHGSRSVIQTELELIAERTLVRCDLVVDVLGEKPVVFNFNENNISGPRTSTSGMIALRDECARLAPTDTVPLLEEKEGGHVFSWKGIRGTEYRGKDGAPEGAAQ